MQDLHYYKKGSMTNKKVSQKNLKKFDGMNSQAYTVKEKIGFDGRHLKLLQLLEKLDEAHYIFRRNSAKLGGKFAE